MRPLLFLPALLALGCSSCTQASTSPGAVVADVALVTCVLSSVSGDVAKNTPWATCLTNAEQRCGASEAQVVSYWGAHVKAEVLEGVVPKMPVPSGE